MSDSLLIETCLEDGALTDEEIVQALAGKTSLPEVKAIISLIENAIANVRRGAETHQGVHRDEFCGAARELRAVRTRLVAATASKPKQ
jgi:transcription initiation factor IIE alpha subunit